MEIHVGFISLQVVVRFLLLTHQTLGDSQSDEVAALMDFKKSVKDHNKALTSWDSTLVNACTWFHITCDDSNHVIRVDLGNAGLGGTISPYLGNLTNLQSLGLYKNRLTDHIPRELGKLKKLISLQLEDNILRGCVPSSLYNIQSFNVSGNKYLKGKCAQP